MTKAIISWAKTFAMVLACLALVVGCALGVAHQAEMEARPCIEMGGHYVPSHITNPEECWSQDGTRRLFPKGM